MKQIISNITKALLALALLAPIFVSCSKVNFDFEPGATGKQGEQGVKGDDALSMYELWKKGVEDGSITEGVDKKNTTMADFFLYLRGNNGKDAPTLLQMWQNALSGNDDVINPTTGSAWNKAKNTDVDFFRFLSGAKGAAGSVPTINKDGNWVIGSTVMKNDDGTPFRAKAKDGRDAIAPRVFIGEKDKDGNQNWKVEYTDYNGNTTVVDLGQRANALDGKTPTITIDPTTKVWMLNGKPTTARAEAKNAPVPNVGLSDDGYWMLPDAAGNLVKTKCPAFGPAGRDGRDGTPGENGAQGSKGDKGPKGDTGAAGNDGQAGTKGDKGDNGLAGPNGAEGLPGDNGKNGKNAYEVWKEYIASGDVSRPQDNGEKWEPSFNSKADFWVFISGTPGAKGETSIQTIQAGKFNVISQFYNGELRERVSPVDGKTIFIVYDKAGNLAPQAKVSNLPGLSADKIYQADGAGRFTVDNEDLPNNLPLTERFGSATVEYQGKKETSAKNTVVPNKVLVRLRISKPYYSSSSYSAVGLLYCYTTPRVYCSLYIERSMDGGETYSRYPDGYEPRYKMSLHPIFNLDRSKDPVSKTRYMRLRDIKDPVAKRYLTDLDVVSDSTSVYGKDGSTFYHIRPVVMPEKYKRVSVDNSFIDRSRVVYNDKYPIQVSYYAAGQYLYGNKEVVSKDAFVLPEIYANPRIFVDGVMVIEGKTAIYGRVDLNDIHTVYSSYGRGDGTAYPEFLWGPEVLTSEDVKAKKWAMFGTVTFAEAFGTILETQGKVKTPLSTSDGKFAIDNVLDNSTFSLKEHVTGMYCDYFEYYRLKKKSNGKFQVLNLYYKNEADQLINGQDDVPLTGSIPAGYNNNNNN